MESKKEVSNYLENISIIILGVFLFAFPLVFTSVTTDPFTMPKQFLLIAVGLILMLLSGARMISEGTVRIRRTPFDFPLAIFGVVLLVSAFLSINRFDAIFSAVPAVFAIILYFFIINLSKNRPAYSFLLTAFLTGGAVAGLLAVLSYARLYIFPMPFTKDPSFTPLGTTLDLALYMVFVLPIVGYFAYHLFRHVQTTYMGHGEKASHQLPSLTDTPVGMGFTAAATLFIVLGVVISVYQLVMVNPILLPFDTGFRTALASISQDTGRVIQAFLFGSGYGTYNVDFTRFKDQAFNLNPSLWSLTFFRSSSYVLELLATTGVLGLVSFGYILYTLFGLLRNADPRKGVKNPIMLSVALIAVSSVLLPFSPVVLVLFFILLALFAAEERLDTRKSDKYHDVELHFVAFTEGLMPLAATPVTQSDHRVQKDYTKILPVSLFILFAITVALVGFYTYNFAASDVIFQRSLVAASQNNGLQTYTDQVTAIRTFPYRDAYYRIASQTDLALANSLASSVPAGSSPSAQIQQNVTALIQEAITTSRTATQLAPATSINWQNLSSVYRGLIGFGQNAEQFAVATQQQAIALNPNDPQGYINLGGIFYQLTAWDNAQQAFQTAISLKPDYPNAYYNLGHALENKGDLQNALLAYQQVEQIVASDKAASEKIAGEINALKAKIANQQTAAQTPPPADPTAQAEGTNALEENRPQTQLPQQQEQNQVKIPAPTVTVTPAPSSAVTPSPSNAAPTPALQ